MEKRRINKIISLILALSLLLSMFTVNMFVSAETEPAIWDGTRTAPTEGSGTVADPYKITNGAELAYVIVSGGGANTYYELTADIYLNDVDKIDWSTGAVDDGYTPNSWYEVWTVNSKLGGSDFQGIIDGNGYVIYGLYYNEAPASYTEYQEGAALIPRVMTGGDATIINLGMDYVYIDDNTTAAAFVAVTMGDNTTVNIDSCYVGANATLKASNAGAFRGYSRASYGGSITNCYSLATTVGTRSTGLSAFNWEASGDQLLIANCYNANGAVSTHGDTGYYAAVENCYETVASAFSEGTTVLTADNMQGLDALTSGTKMSGINSDNKYVATETYPVLRAFTDLAPEEPEEPEVPEYEVWSGNSVEPTETDDEGNILINNAEELAYIIENGGGAGNNYKLTTDIYLNYLNKVDWTTGSAIGSYRINSWKDNVAFQGNIDGDGFVVYGLYIKKNGTAGWGFSGQGLIPRVAAGASVSVTGLGIDYAYVTGVNGASAFVGFAGTQSAADWTNVTIDKCYVGENVVLTGHDVGAFRGGTYQSNTTITNSYSLATLNGASTKGLIGNHWSVNVTVENSFNANGAITSDGYEWANIADNLKNVYATDSGQYTSEVKQLTADNMKGYDVLKSESKMSALNAGGAFYAMEGYPVLRIFLAKTNPDLLKVWDGASKTQPAGEGTKAAPYLVSNGAELAWAISNCTAGEYVKLTDDIYLNQIDKINWATGEANETYTPNTWLTDVAFNGNIDGDGHVVYGVYYNAGLTTDQMAEGWASPAGLIPSVANGANITIQKLGVDRMYINANNTASAFIGAAGNSSANTEADRSVITIDQCFVGSHVDVTAFSAGVFRGFSKNNGMYIYNSYNLGKFRSNVDKASDIDAGTYDYRFSWFIANSWGLKNELFIENCYNATGAIFKGSWTDLHNQIINSYAAGLTQDKDGDGVAEEVWYSAAGNTPLTEDQMKGKDVFSASAKMPLLNAKGMYVARAGYPVLKIFAGEAAQMPEGVWDGYSVSEPAGKGTEGLPYLIATPAELAWAISNGGQGNYYKLTADIYLNDVSKINWLTGEVAEEYAPNTWYNNTAFEGVINGNGHVVYGLYYDDEPESMTWGYNGKGLIPRVNLGTTVVIKNLGVDKSYISGKNGASAFVGFAGARTDSDATVSYANVTIDSCYVGAETAIVANQAGAFRGGVRGANTTITNSYSLAQLTTVGNNGTKGLVANLWSSYLTVKNSYNATDAITTDEYMSGYFTFSGAYAIDAGAYYNSVHVVTADKMQGTDVLKNVLKMPYLNGDGIFVATETYPTPGIFVKSQPGGSEGGEGGATPEPETPVVEIWDGSTKTEPTATDDMGNILIANGAELAWVIENGGGADKAYKLTANIYLNDVTKIDWATGEAEAGYTPNQWLQNEEFQGTLNGDGFVVYGLYSKGNHESFEFGYWGQGLIPRVNNGTTANIVALGVDKAYISGPNAASAFVGFTGPTIYDAEAEYATVNIDQCYVGADVYMEAFCAGAFRGGNYKGYTNITNSYSLGTVVSSESGTDGFVGGLWSAGVTVFNSFNANGSLCHEWSPFTSGGNNYATGWDEDKTASGEGLVAYRADRISAENMQGLDVFTNASKMPKLNSTGVYVETRGYPMLSVFAKRTNPELFKCWDGTTTAAPKGDGTIDSPYLITNGAELAYAITSGGGADKYYKLTADIYLNKLDKINWATGEAVDGYTPNAWFENTVFQGNIDGDGHVVYGLYFKTTSETSAFGYVGVGLIPRVSLGASVTVNSLGVDYAYLSSVNGASAFVGAAGATSGGDDVSNKANITIDKCYAGENVTILGHDIGAFRGTTYGSVTTITNSYSLATLQDVTAKGFVGNLWGAKVVVENSFNANGPIANESWLWTDVGENFKNVYATDNSLYSGEVTHITLDEITGLSALAKLSGLSSDIFVPVVGKVPAIKDFLKGTATKNDTDYIGYAYSDVADYFTTPDASKYFWRYNRIDANGDETMDICDLVYATINGGLDVDKDNLATSFDMVVLRKALIGETDYDEPPVKLNPYNDNLTGVYNLVWNDEFNGDYLDASKWGVYSKMETNPEMGYFNDKDEKVIDVVDGHLKLTAYKDADGNYHSPTSVITQNTMNFKYGYVEIRAKLPLQTGVWSSFWAKSVADKSDVKSVVSSDNPVVGEVDIFEVFDRNRVCGNIIKWDPVVNEGEKTWWYPTAMNTAQCVVPPDDDQFHIYAYEWTPTEIKFYYDGVMYARFDITEPWLNPGEDGKGMEGYEYNIKDETGSDMSCYHDPQYLIFNNHLFYEGVSNANEYIYNSNPGFTSADYLIDYCRVYQLEGQGEIYTK